MKDKKKISFCDWIEQTFLIFFPLFGREGREGKDAVYN